MRCPDDASSFLIAWARFSMLGTRCAALFARRWRKASGGASQTELLGEAERVPAWSRKMCRSPLSKW
ncbi:hypothetical protein NL676_020752 [Syzygium grande]|nr:hypothetical protein NL676_020752 [Syzygium grande]